MTKCIIVSKERIFFFKKKCGIVDIVRSESENAKQKCIEKYDESLVESRLTSLLEFLIYLYLF